VIVNELFYQFDHGEILHTMTVARAIGMTTDEFRRYLGDDAITFLKMIENISPPEEVRKT